jgi:hypothetical protein
MIELIPAGHILGYPMRDIQVLCHRFLVVGAVGPLHTLASTKVEKNGSYTNHPKPQQLRSALECLERLVSPSHGGPS